ncbi:MAG TPA: PPC domain-containing protein [Pirellulales bacterium]
MKHFFPAGAQVGKTVDIEAHGKFDAWPVQTWVDRPGVTVSPKETKGALAVTVAADATPGVYWLRLYSAEGTSSPAPFFVCNLPETNEQEPNDSPAKSQELATPNIIVNGRLQSKGDVDTFSIRVEKGQTLVAEIEAHRTLASPLDAVLEVVSPDGFVLEHNDDDQGMDPRIVFTAPESGLYRVRTFGFPATPDSSIALAGNDALIYRLTMTVDGFCDYSLPLAITAENQQVEVHGWNLSEETRRLIPRLLPEAKQAVLVHPRIANSLVLPLETHPCIVANEPSKPGSPQAIQLPVTITGRIETARDKDTFRFSAKNGETINFRVESRSLGYPLDPVLEVFDSQGKSLARVDDLGESRDPQLAFAAPADGEYDVTVTDLHRHGGPRFVYRLTATIVGPDFKLSLATDSFTVSAGQKLELPVTVERLQGLKEAIPLRVEGLPSGVTVEPAVSQAEGETAKSLKLVVTANDVPFAGPIRVVGGAANAGGTVHFAEATMSGRAQRTTSIWLTIGAADKK